MPKRDLTFNKPVMNAAGTLGFAPDPRAPIAWDELGAFVTNPVSMRRRGPAEHPALVQYPGGILIHSGLPNPGFERVLEKNARTWAQSPLPIIVNLIADRPEQTREMVHTLEGLDSVMAAELGFSPFLDGDIVLLAIEMSVGEMPLIVGLPPEQLLTLGPRAIERGAAALSITPPRGVLLVKGTHVSGRLFGSCLFPRTMELVRTASRKDLPNIGAGGVTSEADIAALLDAGALAVQVDTALWVPRNNKKSLVN